MPERSEVTRNSLSASLFTGALTGGMEAAIIHPLTTIKARLQQGNKGKITIREFFPVNPSFYQIARGSYDFTKFLYRGVTTHVIGMGVVVSIRMMINDGMLRFVFNNNQSTYQQKMLSAAAGGVLSAYFTVPKELIMTLQQTATTTQKGPNILNAYRDVIKTWGPRKLLTGGLAVGGRDGLVTAGSFSITPHYKRYLVKNFSMDENTAALLAGTCIGATASIATHPLDTIKTVQQTNLRDSKNPAAISFSGAGRQIIKEEGFKGFYRGVFWRTARVAPHVAIVAELTERITKVWNKAL